MERVYFIPYKEIVELISIDTVNDIVNLKVEGMEVTTKRKGIKLLEEIFVCSNCGSMNIEHEAWVKTNTNEYSEDSSEPSIFCCDCGTHSSEFVMYDEFHKSINK